MRRTLRRQIAQNQWIDVPMWLSNRSIMPLDQENTKRKNLNTNVKFNRNELAE
jgi:hypothetical protein